MCRVMYAKELRMIKNILIKLSQKINNLITQGLLSVMNYVGSNMRYKNKKKLCYN